MLQWITKKLTKAGDRSAEKAIDRFILDLEECNDFQLANNLLLATILRLNLADSGQNVDTLFFPDQLKLENMEEYLQRSKAEGLVMKLINTFSSNKQHHDSFAMRIWLNSLWGYRLPELRPKVHYMWEMLQSGLCELDRAKKAAANVAKRPIPENIDEEVRRVPFLYSSKSPL